MDCRFPVFIVIIKQSGLFDNFDILSQSLSHTQVTKRLRVDYNNKIVQRNIPMQNSRNAGLYGLNEKLHYLLVCTLFKKIRSKAGE